MARGAALAAGARRLAPRRLGSGRRGRADAEAWRHARLRTLRPEPPCLNVPLVQPRGLQTHSRSSARCSKALSRSVPTSRRGPNLVSARRLHDEAAVHAHVPHPAGGALERRCSDHRPGLRLHARATCARSAELLEPTRGSYRTRSGSVRAVDAKTVRVVFALPIRRLARSVRHRPPAPRSRAART